jgi:hypothetical protein
MEAINACRMGSSGKSLGWKLSVFGLRNSSEFIDEVDVGQLFIEQQT